MDNPNYYGIIPANIRYDENLTSLEKFLYCEFTALSNLNGYCYSKNEYFAKLYNKDKATISRAINHLEELRYIKVEYEKQGNRITKRRIYPLDIKTTDDKIINGTEITDDKNVTREQQKLLLTVDKIVKDNNSSYEDIIKLIIVSFNKDKKEDAILKEFEFSPAVVDSINLWLKYKKEKKQGYKETGFRTLCKDLQKMIDSNGEQYLLDAIHSSISRSYAGIFPDNKSNSSYQRKPYNQPITRNSEIKKIGENTFKI